MSLELFLIRYGLIGSYFSLISTILFIKSAYESEEIESSNIQKKTPPKFCPTPSEIVLIALIFSMISNAITYQVVQTRLDQLASDLAAGRSTTQIEPNIYLTIGTFLSFLGSVISTIGGKKKVESEAEFIII